jgi:cysteine sulfinate desulfinase/cysteine desulfurase-like protein
MKDWLYDNKSVEVVVHKALGHNILRFSIHAHTSAEDVLALFYAVSNYL